MAAHANREGNLRGGHTAGPASRRRSGHRASGGAEHLRTGQDAPRGCHCRPGVPRRPGP